ncbi:tRNA-splicing endonuclease subunit Sen15 [Metarhizium album ARSEF 1941]|uniref:tRNA-splicing endonuclease subunit Sen15 n=1 Tax=Metarhizium album (strain ARSEF 1941) TaxID=1081103 RepID=A0A0B2WXA3_METAS|nr:tRNA-splicing endonuclease subunit Sen15 [Metarhizium album ARSEF 1941]KHO00877.1 tRNA-splicing endonuclease subunit Sen15 [Metarhizium album ARSEF 1941]
MIVEQEQHESPAVNDICDAVLHNLADQHDWTSLELRDGPEQPRPLIKGLPPKRLYLHPDDQIAALAHEEATGEKLFQNPEYVLVLAVHINERWTLAKFAAVFDSIPSDDAQPKRILFATLHNDSTVVYYWMHEGMVKPRQN